MTLLEILDTKQLSQQVKKKTGPVAMSATNTLASSNPLLHSFLRVQVETCIGMLHVVKTQPWAYMG